MNTLIKATLKKCGYELRRIQSENRQADYTRDLTRLRRLGERSASLKLHIGCGPRILKGWVNVDLAYEPYEQYMKYYTDEFYPPAIRGDKEDFFAIDVTKMGLSLPDCSVDAIFHEDFLEHLDQKEQIIFLAETRRVLKRGAVHRVNTPNLIDSMNRNSRFLEGLSGVYTREWTDHGHRNVLSPGQLAELAYMVGYAEVSFTERDRSRCPYIPREYRPDPADRPESGNIFADLVA